MGVVFAYYGHEWWVWPVSRNYVFKMLEVMYSANKKYYQYEAKEDVCGMKKTDVSGHEYSM